jgi:hypothetical protein
MTLADREGHVVAALRARNNLAATLIFEAPLGAVLQLTNEGVDLALKFGLSGWGAQHLVSRTTANLEIGDWESARSDLALLADWDLSELHAALRATGNAFLAAAAGDAAAAEAGLAEAREDLPKIDTLPQVSAIGIAIGQVHLLLGAWKAALETLEGLEGGGNDPIIAQFRAFAAAGAGDRDTLAALQARVASFDQLRAADAIRTQVDASLAATTGRWDEARVAYVAAAAKYSSLDYHLEGALLGLESSAYLGDRFDDARLAGDAAETWFAERGATSVVERYREAFAGTPAPSVTGAGAKPRAVPVDAEQPA